jgi:RalA-binding protein 1
LVDSGLDSRADRLNGLTELIPQLPVVNYKTMQALFAHLIRVIQNSSKNKMNLRNISIVFSPTLGIPAGLFGIMLAEYPVLFGDRDLSGLNTGSQGSTEIPPVSAEAQSLSHSDSMPKPDQM